MEVQTRTEQGELRFFKTFKEGIDHANSTPLFGSDSVYKITVTMDNKEQIRMVRIPAGSPSDGVSWYWKYAPIEIPDNLSNEALGVKCGTCP